MTKKIVGDLSVSRNTTINGKNVVTNFNTVNADADTGNIDFSFMRTKDVLDTMSMLPVSRVGTMDYLSMNINGSFEGATNLNLSNYGYGIIPTIIEDDGTMVSIRRGTDGNTVNFYYTSQRNIRSSSVINPTSTNAIFKPAYFTGSQYLNSFVGTNAAELLMFSTTAGSTQYYGLSITNGTLNSISHQSTQIPKNSFDAGYLPQYAHIVNGLIYIWCMPTDEATNTPINIKLYTIPVASVLAGTTDNFKNITGFSGNDLYSTPYTASPTIKLTDSQVSTVPADKPLFVMTGEDTLRVSLFYNKNGYIQAAGNSDNTLIRVAVFRPYRVGGKFTSDNQRYYGFSFTYNIATNAIIRDNNVVAPITVSFSGFTYTENNPFSINYANICGMSSGYFGRSASMCQTSDGFLLANFGQWASEISYAATLSTVQNYTDDFSSWKLPDRKIAYQAYGVIRPTFGSALGENFLSPRVISSTEMIINCGGTDTEGNTFDYDGLVKASFGSAPPTFDYKSLVQGGTIKGYAPQVERDVISGNIELNSAFGGTISLVEADGTVNCYGSSYTEIIPTKEIKLKLNPTDLTWSSDFTIPANLMTTLKNQIVTASAIADVVSSNITFYYVPDSTFSKSIAIVKCSTSTREGWIVIAECDVVVTGTALTSVTMLSTFKGICAGVGNLANPGYTALPRTCTGLTIGKFSDVTFMYVGDSANFNVPANQYPYGALVKIKNGRISGDIKPQYYSYDASNTSAVGCGGVIPNLGFGLFQFGDLGDYKTKLIFRSHGKTEAELDEFLASPTSTATGTPYVVLSQEVAQGFIVYFTQEVPVFICGTYYNIPPTTVDLTTIKANPASSTFYMYVVMNQSTKAASYFISTIELTEELNRVYIGTIVTGATAITSIVSEKVTRFLTFRPSITKRGSAIPASTGVPSSTGTRWK